MAPRFVYCGTESDTILGYELYDDGTLGAEQRVKVANPMNLKHGSPSGLAVEWVVAHPSGDWLYAFVCHWDKRHGDLYIFSIGEHGDLSDVDCISTCGFQPCHAQLFDGRWLAVAHYLSGCVSIFDVANGPATLVARMHLPDERLSDGIASEDVPFSAPKFGEKAPLAHGLAFSHDGNWIVVADCGQSAIVTLSFDVHSGALASPSCSHVSCPPVVGGRMQYFLVRKLGHRPRHVAFTADGSMLVVVHECANAVTLHAFNRLKGTVGPAIQQCASFNLVSTGCCSFMQCLLGIAAASEVAVHATSGTSYVTTRGIGATKSTIRSLQLLASPTGQQSHLTVGHDIDVGKNPRHMLLDATQSTMVVGLKGGISVFDVCPSGRLSLRARNSLPHKGDTVDCIAIVEKDQGTLSLGSLLSFFC